MTHQAEKDPKATIEALQEQFRDLCVIGMRGAEAISSFRENKQRPFLCALLLSVAN